MAPTASGYQVGDKHVRVIFDLPVDQVDLKSKKNDAADNRLMLFVVDKSGSMCTDFGQVTQAVKYMLDANPNGNAQFILYNDVASFATAEQVMNTKATGMTSFQSALKLVVSKMQLFIATDKGVSDINIVFMTDGQDSASSNLKGAIADLKTNVEFFSTANRRISLHTIGFGRDHSKVFLDQLRDITGGNGMYRFAAKQGLDTNFAELFDFLDLTRSYKLRVGDIEKEVDVILNKKDTGNTFTVDAIFPRKALETFVAENGELSVKMGDAAILLSQIPLDFYFSLQEVEACDITDMDSLLVAQTTLNSINPLKVNKEQRHAACELKASVQEQLDKYYQIFADIARGSVTGTNIAATLSSMRYNFKFNKSRRARTMNTRATKNANLFSNIDDRLQALGTLSAEDLKEFSSLDYTCPLSGDTISEVMSNSPSDVMVFSLRVTRPEYAIDAPSQLVLNDVLVGTYSYDAFFQSMRFAVSQVTNAALTHGGFGAEVSENTGFFRGPDGRFMNACLPMYINEKHWSRVEVQLEPLLGYFFTLDPMGFKGDQFLAIFGILESMIIMRENGTFTHDWADFIIQDFKKVCAAIKQRALKYLAAGYYALGKLTTDPLQAFIAGPAGRTKEVLPNIFTVFGWKEVTDPSTYDKKRFDICALEEIWRRGFSAKYKTQPREIVMSMIEKLIYGPKTDDSAEDGADGAGAVAKVGRRENKNDKEFAKFAVWKMGEATKRQAEAMSAAYGDSGSPDILGLLEEDEGYVSREIVDFKLNEAYMLDMMTNILDRIKDHNMVFDKITDGFVFGDTLDPQMKWLLLIQALQFCSNDLANAGVASGEYKNSYDFLENPGELLTVLHEAFDRSRKLSHAACVREKNYMLTAMQIVATRDVDAFIGRMMKSCPTRGGNVFDYVVSMLHTPPDDMPTVKLVNEKFKIIFTGMHHVSEGKDVVVHGEGKCWIHCLPDVAKAVKAAMGEDAFTAMELSMYGHWGWAYRPSDIPNRHGHCVSNPNSDLAYQFAGFKL